MCDTEHMSIQNYNNKLNLYTYIGLVLTQELFCMSYMTMYLVAGFILKDIKCHIYVTLSIKDPELIRITQIFVEKILELSSNYRLYMREIIFGGSRIFDKFD